MTNKRTNAEADNFKRINVISRAVEKRLHEAGIRTFAKLASLSPDAIATLLDDVTGITIERIIKQDWIGQAGKLASKSETPESGDDAEIDEDYPGGRKKELISFVVELLFDEEGFVKLTKIMQVATGHEEIWSGWQEEHLIDYFIKHAPVRFPSAESAPLPVLQAETPVLPIVPVEPDPPAATTPEPVHSSDLVISPPSPAAAPVALASGLRLEGLQITRAHSPVPTSALEANAPFEIGLTIDLTELDPQIQGPFNYKATLYAASPAGKSRQTVEETQGSLTLAGRVAIRMKGRPLPPGLYRFQVVAALTARNLERSLVAQIESRIIQVI